jgi:hypothetical protein
MEKAVKIWILGGFALAFDSASLVLNILFATSLADVAKLDALRILLFVSLGLQVVAIGSLTYFAFFHVPKLGRTSLTVTSAIWWIYVYGASVAAAALALIGLTLVWSVIRQEDLPSTVVGLHPMVMLGIWFGAWGVTLALQTAFYVMLGLWTRAVLKVQSVGRLDLDFGIRLPPMGEVRPQTQDTQRTFSSQDMTLRSPPRTPTSRGPPSSSRSSVTRVGPGSSRIKLVKGSARSSLDIPPFPAGEATSIDSAFDNWDTSCVHRELRVAAMTSSPPTRSGLETIPGSRPESPADALDGPFLPPSPTMYSPHANSSETAEAVGWYPTSPLRAQDSTPPSSPPNFSRPTSAQHNKPLVFGSLQDSPMQDLIHPLFRPNSPEPPPLAVGGTMVTASPIANQPITPKTLARIRSVGQVSHWRAMPSVDDTNRPRSADSVSSSAGFGSPGPSIVDEEEYLPPTVLPGFVMSAGQRSSLVGYGKRKSLKKERRQSQMSAGSRLSQVMM